MGENEGQLSAKYKQNTLIYTTGARKVKFKIALLHNITMQATYVDGFRTCDWIVTAWFKQIGCALCNLPLFESILLNGHCTQRKMFRYFGIPF